jgi:hypothetical protein
MRNLALLGIDVMLLPLLIGVAGFAVFAYQGDSRIDAGWTDAAWSTAALLALVVFRRGVKSAKLISCVGSLVVCLIYASHFGLILYEEGTLPNGIIWVAALGSFAGVIGLVGSLILKSPPLGKSEM